ncbi:type II secretion system F family protein [Nocardioides campestrisoli]|uniref:type II secretion system F family protein n=1 Tax=Nocardioides campestrisoli TaxID=2736757 RepID=UPI002810B107|nr:type II secretion system F family protein [Nocardioides campestrisoli]
MSPALLAGLALGAAMLLVRSPRPSLRPPCDPPGYGAGAQAAGRAAGGRSPVRRAVVAALAGAGAWLFVGGPLGLPSAVLVAVVCWRLLGRSEPPAVRRARVQATRELPHLVGLMAAGLRAGAPPSAALAGACAALPGAAAEAFAGARARLALGMDPATVWDELAEEPGIAVLGRALARAHQTGAPVSDTVEALAVQLAQEGRAAAEDRARGVGVWAALPLGLCLLPGFLLLGVVPVVAGLAAQLGAR